MKRWTKQLVAFAAVMLISCLTFGMLAHADGKLPPKKELAERTSYVYGNSGQFELDFEDGTEFSNIKSSNSAINAKAVSSEDGTFILVTAKKEAKGTVSFKASADGKSESYKTKVTFIKYTNPFKLIKVGKTDYTSKFKKEDYQVDVKKVVSGKLVIKPAKGFKLRDIYIMSNENFEVVKTVKNNSNIKLKKSQHLQVTYTYKGWQTGITALNVWW